MFLKRSNGSSENEFDVDEKERIFDESKEKDS